MYLWRKAAEPGWLNASEEILQTRSRGTLAIVAKPGLKRLRLEIACKSQRQAQSLLHDFGGHVENLGRGWLRQFAREQTSKTLKIGKRLIVTNVGGTSASRRSGHRGPSHLVIPAGAAFGTGEHATTAMSLRLLERLTRQLWGAVAAATWQTFPPVFSRANCRIAFRRGRRRNVHARRVPSPTVVDLGTGSGILALAAARFGARRVQAIDLDPTAISTAKANARANKIDNVEFCVGDVRDWKPAGKIDIVTANLFSELLIEILPKLKRSDWLILSGVLRAQERELVRALRRNQIGIVEVRRRGKWLAVLARPGTQIS